MSVTDAIKKQDSLETARQLYEAMDFSKFAVVTKPKTYTMGDGKMKITVVYETNGLELLRGECEPGGKVEPHTHTQLENILMYEGEGTITVAGTKHHMTVGSTIGIPAGVIHHTQSFAGCKIIIARIPPIVGVY